MRVLGLTDSSTGYLVFTSLTLFSPSIKWGRIAHTLHMCEQQCTVTHWGWLGGPPGIVESL